MDLHDGKAGVRKGVPEGEAVGGECAGVDDDAGGALAALLEAVYECALTVGLEAVDVEAEVSGAAAEAVLDLGEGDCAVVGRGPAGRGG